MRQPEHFTVHWDDGTADRVALAALEAPADRDDADELVERFWRTIQIIAAGLAHRLSPAMDVDDLVAAGVIGLLDAAARYDPGRHVRFATYAPFRIRGAMLDEIRTMDHVPRSVWDVYHKIDGARRALVGRLRREPTQEELAAEMGVDLPALHRMRGLTARTALVPLDDLADDHGDVGWIAPDHDADPSAGLRRRGHVAGVGRLVDRLPGRERAVVRLYYWEDLTMREIGGILGLTESRISQIRARAVERLRGRAAEAAA